MLKISSGIAMNQKNKQSNDVARAIKYIGGYSNTQGRLISLGIKVTLKSLKEWAKNGAIPAENCRCAVAIESLTGNKFQVDDLCPDVFSGFEFL